MAVDAVSAAGQSKAAFGLDFQTLLKIILTEMTYQDPLKPMDNFEFVSQLGQFAQLQQSQSLNDTVTQLLAAQAAAQATSLLGRTVDVATGSATLSGSVTAISFSSGQPAVTIKMSDGNTISGISISTITQIR